MASEDITGTRKLGPRKAQPGTGQRKPRMATGELARIPGPRRAAKLAAESSTKGSQEQDYQADSISARSAETVTEQELSGARQVQSAAVQDNEDPTRGRGQRAGRVKPVAGSARVRKRHWLLIVNFGLLVLLPLAFAGWYLWFRAVDQYASTIGFTVHKEDTTAAVDLLGGLSQLSGGGSADTDILYEFIQSQDLVASIDKELNLRAAYSKDFDADPVFSLKPNATIEDLVEHWGRMVKIIYEPGTGLIELRVLAADPVMARTIATAIFDKSSLMINRLSAIARDDTTRYAREELDLSVDRLKAAREAITSYRSRTQIVDPQADIQGQMGLLNTLQAQLASALIDLDLLRQSTREGDPRIAPAQSRIAVIQARIDDERQKFGVGGKGPGGEDYATLVAEYERLSVDLEFAEAAYRASLSAYDGALAEAQRKSRYLAAHVEPTLAESSQYPQRPVIMLVAALFLILLWSIIALVYYSVRDRR